MFLLDIAGRFEKSVEEPIMADWFSGMLRVPRGKIVEYVHMGFGSVYEKEEHITVEKGIVTERTVIDNRGKTFDRRKLTRDNLPGSDVPYGID